MEPSPECIRDRDGLQDDRRGRTPPRHREQAERDESTIEAISTHLRLELLLTEADAERIARLVGDMYQALAKLARRRLHLRSATTFKPAAAMMLGALLDDLRMSLESGMSFVRGFKAEAEPRASAQLRLGAQPGRLGRAT